MAWQRTGHPAGQSTEWVGNRKHISDLACLTASRAARHLRGGGAASSRGPARPRAVPGAHELLGGLLKGKPRLLTVLWLALALPACGDSATGPPVPEEPTEVTLADYSQSPIVDASAFSWIILQKVRTDQTSEWDFVFVLDDDGQAQLYPRSSVLAEPSTSGLQVVDESFEQLTVAPADGYITDEPVAVVVGDVLAAVSQRRCGSAVGLALVRFGKLEVLAIDPARRTLTFKQLANPNCENRSLVPGEVGGT